MHVEQTDPDPKGKYLRDLYVPVRALHDRDSTNWIKISFFHNKYKGRLCIFLRRCHRNTDSTVETVKIEDNAKVDLVSMKKRDYSEINSWINGTVTCLLLDRGIVYNGLIAFMTQHQLESRFVEDLSA